jgi:hypothetical protein
MIAVRNLKDFTFHIVVVEVDNLEQYEMTVFRDNVLEHDPKLFETSGDVARWIRYILDWSSND